MVHSHPCAAKKGCLAEIWQVVLGTSKGCVQAGSGAARRWAVLNLGCVKGAARACPGCNTPSSDGGCSEARGSLAGWFLHTPRCWHSWAQGCTACQNPPAELLSPQDGTEGWQPRPEAQSSTDVHAVMSLCCCRGQEFLVPSLFFPLCLPVSVREDKRAAGSGLSFLAATIFGQYPVRIC